LPRLRRGYPRKKKKIQEQNCPGCEARPASPSPQSAGNNQAKRGITQNEGDQDAAQNPEDAAGNYSGGQASQSDYES